MIALLFGVLFLCLLIGVPISISLGVAAVAVLLAQGNPTMYPIIAQRLFTATDSFPLMAVPFFILAGNLMERGGISKRLIDFVKILLRKLPAASACITTAASAFFGAISGSNPATVAAIGGIMAPSMKQTGYPDDEIGAVAAASGTLGVVIPPSIPMVTYSITASVSVGVMFMAGLVPGLLLAVALIIVHQFRQRKYEMGMNIKVTGREIWHAFKDALLALIMPLIILGGIYGGFFTATESAAVACVYAFIISVFVFKELKLGELKDIFVKSAKSSAIVLFVVSLSAPFAYLMTSMGMAVKIADTVVGAFQSNLLIMLMINVVLLFLGCFLETQSIILLVTPVLLPIAKSIGMDPIVLGIIIVVNTSVGMITPPMAVNLFVASSITKSPIESISKKVLPYLGAEIIVLLLLTYIPAIILALPRLLGMM